MNSPRFITTTAGVRIGCAYQRPAPRPTRDHEHLQSALLEPRTAYRMSRLRMLVGRVWRWL